ncbi:MAG: type II toxin-antitoxin system HipA family toxin [Euzebya sp.]
MSTVEVVVSITGTDVPAATLRPTLRNGRHVGAELIYQPGYLATTGAYPIDPALPLASGSQFTAPGQPLFAALTDCAPDRWGRLLMQKAERLRAGEAGTAPRTLTEIDVLLGARDDMRQGALRFRRDTDGPFLAEAEEGVPAVAELGQLLHLSRRNEDDALVADELARLVRGGSSLGGARPKAHVRTGHGTAAIAKFPSVRQDTWDVMAWEAVALHLARTAGVTVPDNQLIRIAGRSVLIIERFDRVGPLRERTPPERVGYVSAMTMLGRRDGDAGDFLDLAEVVEEQSPSATADMVQLWRRAVFSALIANTDNHLRNHGFLRVQGGWTLAPAFDLNPTPDSAELAVGVAGNTVAPLTAAVESCELFRLDSAEALEVLAEVVDAVGGWSHVARQHGVDTAGIQRIRPAFQGEAAAQARRLLAH